MKQRRIFRVLLPSLLSISSLPIHFPFPFFLYLTNKAAIIRKKDILLQIMAVDNAKQKKKYADLPLVPESLLRKRHDLDDLARRRAANLEVQQRQRQQGGNNRSTKPSSGTGGASGKKKKAFYVKKPETIVARAKSRRHARIRHRRVQRKGMQTRASPHEKQYAEREVQVQDDGDDDERVATATKTKTIKFQSNSVGAKMVFAVRIRNDVGTPRAVREALDRLQLRRERDGAFVRYDTERNRKLLHLVEPYVVYGPPSRAVVADLIERRAYAKVGGGGEGIPEVERVPLSDNTVIERALGESHNILCKEDLVHELCRAGEAFDAIVQDFLWPFRLSDSKSRFERGTLKLQDNGRDAYGDRGEAIAEYIQQVL